MQHSLRIKPMATLHLLAEPMARRRPEVRPYSSGDFILDDTRHNTDHDILIEQTTLLKVLVVDVGRIRDDQRGDRSSTDQRIRDVDSKMDARLRVLEQGFWKMIGAAAAVAAIVGFLSHVIFK